MMGFQERLKVFASSPAAGYAAGTAFPIIAIRDSDALPIANQRPGQRRLSGGQVQNDLRSTSG
jgi:hypothetical protein